MNNPAKPASGGEPQRGTVPFSSDENRDSPPDENRDSSRLALGRLVAVRMAAVAAVFSLLVAALLAYDFSRRQMKDPFAAQQIQDLRDALREQPSADGLKEEIRALDEQLRREYFRERTFAVVGAGLLAGGIVVLLLAAKTAATLGRRLPAPALLAPPPDFDARVSPLARWAVAGLAFLLADAAVVLALGHCLRSPLQQSAAGGFARAACRLAPSPPAPSPPPQPAAAAAAATAPSDSGDPQCLAPVPRARRLRHLALHQRARRPGTPPPARTSSGRRRSRCPATVRRWSAAGGCSSPAPTTSGGRSSASMRPAGELLWQQDVPGHAARQQAGEGE